MDNPLIRQWGDALRRWRAAPQLMVRELFKCTPDPWQDDVLAAFLSNPRVAMTACKGPGKTAVLAWLSWNFLLTRPSPKILATSVSGDNLDDNLWPEMAKWMKRAPMLDLTFNWTKTRIFSRENPEEHFMSARTWSKSADSSQQADTLAGTHSDYIMFILDESGSLPAAVMVAAEAGLSSCIEGHIVQAGNPTRLEGPLYRANTDERHLWHLVNITGDPDDPKRSPRVKVEWARQQIASYGKDNPWVLVNVFGRFPPTSINSLLGPDEVRAAMGRHYRTHEYDFAARILGVDVAREGDDASVIYRRQGLVASVPGGILDRPPYVMRNVDGLQGAGAVATQMAQWDADACFVDNTGGFGASWIDQLRVLGHSPTPIHFAGKAIDGRYYNKRAEIYFLLAQWVKEGGALPNDPLLVGELTTPTYWFKGDQMIIEDKDQIKDRLGRSPDRADALALTFSYPTLAKPRGEAALRAKLQRAADVARRPADYDPYADL